MQRGARADQASRRSSCNIWVMACLCLILRYRRVLPQGHAAREPERGTGAVGRPCRDGAPAPPRVPSAERRHGHVLCSACSRRTAARRPIPHRRWGHWRRRLASPQRAFRCGMPVDERRVSTADGVMATVWQRAPSRSPSVASSSVTPRLTPDRWCQPGCQHGESGQARSGGRPDVGRSARSARTCRRRDGRRQRARRGARRPP